MFPSEILCNMCVCENMDEREKGRMNDGEWMIRRGEWGRGEKFLI